MQKIAIIFFITTAWAAKSIIARAFSEEMAARADYCYVAYERFGKDEFDILDIKKVYMETYLLQAIIAKPNEDMRLDYENGPNRRFFFHNSSKASKPRYTTDSKQWYEGDIRGEVVYVERNVTISDDSKKVKRDLANISSTASVYGNGWNPYGNAKSNANVNLELNGKDATVNTAANANVDQNSQHRIAGQEGTDNTQPPPSHLTTQIPTTQPSIAPPITSVATANATAHVIVKVDRDGGEERKTDGGEERKTDSGEERNTDSGEERKPVFRMEKVRVLKIKSKHFIYQKEGPEEFVYDCVVKDPNEKGRVS